MQRRLSPYCSVAHLGSQLIAAVRFTPITIGGAGGALLLGPLVVDPDFAGQGFGKRLIGDALQAAKAAGVKLVVLVGDEPYYGRFGFRPIPLQQITLPGPVDPQPPARRRAGAGRARRVQRSDRRRNERDDRRRTFRLDLPRNSAAREAGNGQTIIDQRGQRCCLPRSCCRGRRRARQDFGHPAGRRASSCRSPSTSRRRPTTRSARSSCATDACSPSGATAPSATPIRRRTREMMAIRAFLNGHEPADLKEATLYSSGEPCVMCMGAIIWCGIKRLVFAASIEQLVDTHRPDRHHRQADRGRRRLLQHRHRRRVAVARSDGRCSRREEVAPLHLPGRARRRNSCVRGEFIRRPTNNTELRNAQCAAVAARACRSASSS